MSLGSPRSPDWLWGRRTFLFKGYQGSFPWGWVGGSDQGLTLSLPLVPRLSMSGAIPQLPLSAFMECIHVTGTQNACNLPAYLGQLLSMQERKSH